jgi:hypothetical protein
MASIMNSAETGWMMLSTPAAYTTGRPLDPGWAVARSVKSASEAAVSEATANPLARRKLIVDACRVLEL